MLTWIVINADAIIDVLGKVVMAASAVAALTPTPKDDGIARIAYKVVDLLALNVGRAKD